MKLRSLFSCSCSLLFLTLVSSEPLMGEDENLPTPEMIIRDGYPSEVHIVKTPDCYLLNLHRIPWSKRNDVEDTTNITRPVVFLQHCLLGSSADYVIQGPGKALAYLLSDKGYDVWLGNFRGNTYSRDHCHLDPDGFDFWKHSWDEMAEHDLPSMLNYVLEYTNQEKIFYVGHSLGTTAFMAMERYHPELYDRIALANLMAPVAYVGHMSSPIKYLANIDGTIQWVLDKLGMGEFLPSNAVVDWFADKVCGEDDAPWLCSSIMFMINGFDLQETNTSLVQTIMSHTPAGASTRTVVHYTQELKAANFAAYDYGKKGNLEHYGQSEPPEYLPENVTAPVATYWGDNDWLAHKIDVLRLTGKLPNLIFNHEIPYKRWNHLDFVYGLHAKTYVYDVMMEQMEDIRASLW